MPVFLLSVASGLGDGDVPTFWLLLLYVRMASLPQSQMNGWFNFELRER